MVNTNGILLSLALVALCSAPAARADQILFNGSFETGDLTGWTVASQFGGGGNWFIQSATGSPVNGLPVAAPPDGTFAAMTDESGPGSQVMIQTFTVAPGAEVNLSFDYFRNNLGPDYVPAADLDYTDFPNQQARVDILSGAAGPFDMGVAVLMNVFQTNSGDTLQDAAYQSLSMDISSAVAAGGTFQLRFAEVDNLGLFNFGVDNVQLDASPEPGTWALVAGVAIVLLGWRIRLAALKRRAD